MNYHSTEWFSEKLSCHYTEAATIVPIQNIVCIAMQGSGNYGLDYKDSDFDSKCIITPTFKDIALNRKPLSTTHIRQNNEHIDLKDIRLYIQTFRKQNLNFLEILFTKYYYTPSSIFAAQWERLIKYREAIAHMNPLRGFVSMKGIATEKYHAMEHRYPTRLPLIEKFDYDPKQLHHLLRIDEFMKRFYNGESYEDCLISDYPDYLIDIKKGLFDLEEARDIANTTMAEIENLYNKAKETMNNKEDVKMVELLEDVSYEIMRLSVENELGVIDSD